MTISRHGPYKERGGPKKIRGETEEICRVRMGHYLKSTTTKTSLLLMAWG